MAVLGISRLSVVPAHFPIPAPHYPVNIFQLQVEAARRFLFDLEITELAEAANIPPDLLQPNLSPNIGLTVAQSAQFMSGLMNIVGQEKAHQYGRASFQCVGASWPRSTTISSLRRAVSSADKLFLRLRDAVQFLGRQFNTDLIVKWHGGAEGHVFDDRGTQCYGYTAKTPMCLIQTGFLAEAIPYLSGINVQLQEVECMACGALACRWHCRLL